MAQTFNECIDAAVDGKLIARAAGKRLKDDYRRFRAAHATSDPANAGARARAELAADLEAQAKHQRRKAKLALDATRRVRGDGFSHRNASGVADIGEAFTDMLEHFGTARFSSVEGRRKAILGMAHAKMEEMLFHFRRGAVGGDRTRWNKADLRNVLKEAFGQDSGDTAAKGLASAWKDTAEWLRQRFNSAGGAIGKLENWGLPQWHDARALRHAGKTAWKQQIRPLLDVAAMRHPLTGKPVSEAELDRVLDDVFAAITTDGWNKREASKQAQGRGALANQRAEHRFLVFRDAEGWLAYQDAFGGGADPFAAMMAHVNGMAKDIAAMEILGPNPDGMIELMKQLIDREAATFDSGGGRLGKVRDFQRAQDRAEIYKKRIDSLWSSIRGATETPVNGRWANVMAAGRSLITASVLGSAAISSISDAGTSMIARRFAGIPASGAIPQIVKGFAQSSRREAVRAGLVLDAALNVFHAQARYVGTFSGPQWAQYVADRVLTWSGLSPWTQAARHAFGMAFQAETAARVGLAFERLPDALRNTFSRHGITPKDWDLMRRAALHQGEMLRPAEIAEQIDPKLAERYLEMIQGETEYAVPTGGHRARTALLDQNRPGTFIGELVRSFAQFKSFGVVFAMLQGRRIHGMAAGGSAAAGAKYAGSLLLSTTLFGAIAYQLKAISAGRDPMDIATPEFWGAALLQGGGLGIYGDFLFSDINRYGGGMAGSFAGPLIERVSDFWNLTAGNVVQLASGEKTQFGRELVKFLRGSVPGGNIWYLRLAFEREAMDQLQYLLDPEANKAFKRKQQFFQREFGQEYFWAPGTKAPQRAPALF